MTPATIIKQAQADGVILALSSSGTIKAVGSEQAVTRWPPNRCPETFKGVFCTTQNRRFPSEELSELVRDGPLTARGNRGQHWGQLAFL